MNDHKIVRLELGPGGRRVHKAMDGYPDELNISIDYYQYNETDPEIIWDLALGLPFGKEARGFTLRENSVDDVYAEHVIEHIGIPVTLEEQKQKGLWKLLGDIYDALKIGGTFRGAVPMWSDPVATLDPTHITKWHPETFEYFGWHNHRGNAVVGWVPFFTPQDGRVFEPVEINPANNQIGFILRKNR